MPLRPETRPSKQATITSEQRALDELARRRVRAIGRCPECGERVERDEDWLRLGPDAFHAACAEDEQAPTPEPLRYLTG